MDKYGIEVIKKRLLVRKPSILHAFNNQAISNSLLASKGMDIADAILAYYDNRQWLQSVKANAVKRIVNCFSVETTIEQHLELYRQLTGAR